MLSSHSEGLQVGKFSYFNLEKFEFVSILVLLMLINLIEVLSIKVQIHSAGIKTQEALVRVV